MKLPPLQEQPYPYPWLVHVYVHEFDNGDCVIDGNNHLSIEASKNWRAFRKSADGTYIPVRDEDDKVKFFSSAIEAARALGYDCEY